MPLNLIIENVTSLPDGGPLSYTFSGTGRIVVGRDQYLDWTLPDANRAISSKHCEVRWQDGSYWLYDLSTNGTFVNQTTRRMTEPQRLRTGDRLYIGHYIVRVHIDGDDAARHVEAPQTTPREHRASDPWEAVGESAPPIEAANLRRHGTPVQEDYASQFIDLQTPERGAESRYRPLPPLYPTSSGGEDWMSGPTAPPHAGTAGWPGSSGGSLPQERTSNPGPPQPDNPWGHSSLGAGDRDRRDGLHAQPPVIGQPSEPDFALPTPGNTPPSSRPTSGGADGFVERFAKGAGVSPDVFAWRDPGDLAEELGALTRLSVDNLKQLLAARAEAKRVARASSQTMIQALDNNPLKFTPTTEDALRILFGRPTSGYLTGRRALEEGFRDLKSHQVKVYSAMQHALRLLLQDLDPESVEASMGDDRGLGALLGSRKARLWDLYATRWDAMTAPHEDGMVDAFMVFFAECYDRDGRK